MSVSTDPKSCKPRILVIDDEPICREYMEIVLSLEGYEIRTADSGATAIELARRDEFDLAITDLNMPGLSGIDTLAGLRRLHPDLAVIVISGAVTSQSARRCREEGAFRVITKPVEPDELRRIVKVALGEALAASA
jgi:two-component system response regulator PilR (NtrC family)